MYIHVNENFGFLLLFVITMLNQCRVFLLMSHRPKGAQCRRTCVHRARKCEPECHHSPWQPIANCVTRLLSMVFSCSLSLQYLQLNLLWRSPVWVSFLDKSRSSRRCCFLTSTCQPQLFPYPSCPVFLQLFV